MASEGFSKSSRENSVKGFTYEIGKEEGIFSFAADAGENTNVWFKKYSTPSAFEAEESEFGSSWSWMGQPGSSITPATGDLNTETGAKISIHQIPDGFEADSFSLDSAGPAVSQGAGGYDGEYIYTVGDSGHCYKWTTSGTLKDSFNPMGFGNGTDVTFDGQYLWVSDGTNDGAIYQITKDGTTVINYRLNFSNRTRGLTFDGTYIINTKRTQDQSGSSINGIYRYNPSDLSLVSGKKTGFAPFGITFNGKYYYTTCRDSSNPTVYRLDKDFNRVDNFQSSTGGDPRGAGWEGYYLWHSDNNSNALYRITGSASLDISYRVSGVT